MVIIATMALAALVLGMCFLCCRGSSFEFRFGFPEKKEGGELVTAKSWVCSLENNSVFAPCDDGPPC